MKTSLTVVLSVICGIALILTAFLFFREDQFVWMGEFVGYRVQKAIGAIVFLLPGVTMIFVSGIVQSEAKAKAGKTDTALPNIQ